MTGEGGAGGGDSTGGCLYQWREVTSCASKCTGLTQSDQRACADILDCYEENDCGPASCSGNSQTCGANALGKGTAGYPFAKQVFDCLECSE